MVAVWPFVLLFRLKTPPRPQGQRTEPESRGGVSCVRTCPHTHTHTQLKSIPLFARRCSRVSGTRAFTCPSASALSPSASSPQSSTPTTPFTEQVSTAHVCSLKGPRKTFFPHKLTCEGSSWEMVFEFCFLKSEFFYLHLIAFGKSVSATWLHFISRSLNWKMAR